jgi:hypothetical protein
MTVEERTSALIDSIGNRGSSLAEIAALITAVEERTKETIRNAGTLTDAVVADVRKFTHPPYPDNPMVVMTEASYTVPASILAPKESAHD